MRHHITKSSADKAKPEAKPYQIHDTLIPGFVLRVQPSGKKIWKLIVQHKPRTLGDYPTMTVAMAREKAKRILNGDEPQREQSATPTLGQFIEKYYREFAETNYSKPSENISHLTRTGFTDIPIDAIRVIDVEKYRTKRLKAGTAPSSINRQLAILKAALQKAVEWQIIEENPIARFKQLKLDSKGVIRYLTPAEEQRLAEALTTADPWVKAFTITALNTGCRRAELWKLTWADVDLKGKLMTIHGKGAKSGQTRHIPLNATAVATLKAWRGDAVPMGHLPVFGEREFKKSWVTLMRRADIEKFRFHDCRHHFASKLVMAGVPLNTVRELLGHADLKMTLRYSHLAPDNLREAVELIG
jgi:integrase